MNSQKKCIKQIVLTILVVAALNIVIVFTFTVYEPTVALAANNDADKKDEIYYGSFAGGGLVALKKRPLHMQGRQQNLILSIKVFLNTIMRMVI